MLLPGSMPRFPKQWFLSPCVDTTSAVGPSPLSSSLQQGLWFEWARVHSAPVPCAPAALLAGVVWASATAASSMSFCLGPGRPCQGEDSQTSSPFTGSAARGGVLDFGPTSYLQSCGQRSLAGCGPQGCKEKQPKRLSTHMRALSLLRGLQDPEESCFLRWGFWPFLPGPTCTERCRFSPLGVHFSLLQSTLSHSPSAISSLSLRSLVSKCSCRATTSFRGLCHSQMRPILDRHVNIAQNLEIHVTVSHVTLGERKSSPSFSRSQAIPGSPTGVCPSPSGPHCLTLLFLSHKAPGWLPLPLVGRHLSRELLQWLLQGHGAMSKGWSGTSTSPPVLGPRAAPLILRSHTCPQEMSSTWASPTLKQSPPTPISILLFPPLPGQLPSVVYILENQHLSAL